MITYASTVSEALATAKPHRPDASGKDGVILVRGTDITPEPISWLWRHWLALGKLHLLAGAPGQGKTTIALAAASTVTMGGRWPDGTRCEVGNVLIWSGEDDPADTLLPRLIAMGADRERVFFIRAARVGGELVPFDPARDMIQLSEAAHRIGDVRLLIVDPVVSAVAGDSHKNTEVRRAMQPLVDLASQLRAAAVGITHLSKGTAGRDPTERVTGSIAFTAVVRVVLLAAKVKGDEGKDKRILVRSKSNIGPDDGGFEYFIEQSEALPGIPASIVTWGAAVEGSARELLADAEREPGDGNNDGDDACDMLRSELSDTWTPADVASKPLRDAGFTKKQIWAASKKLGVIRHKRGMEGGWHWRLRGTNEVAFTLAATEDSTEDSEDSSLQSVESSESSGAVESSATDDDEVL